MGKKGEKKKMKVQKGWSQYEPQETAIAQNRKLQ
jgi:hypothetical protein